MTNQEQTREAKTKDRVDLDEVQRQVDKLQEQLRLARGTQDDVRAPAPLLGRVEELLAHRPLAQADVAGELREPAGRIGEVFAELRPRLKNVGTEDRPAWWLPPGPDAPTGVLNEAVVTLMAYKPVTFRELVALTGAKTDRVAGALGIAVKTRKVVNASTGDEARWFLLPADKKQ